MPFCRKCGRRLPEYSENCMDCGTSTTAPLVKIKTTKKSLAAHSIQAIVPKKETVRATIAKATIPTTTTVSVKVITPNKPAKTITPVKAAALPVIAPVKPRNLAKPVVPAKVYPPHEIIKSNVSLKADFVANPHDYETETFSYNLKCPNDHFWRAGKSLPVSNGKALCPQCGEILKKPKRKGHHRKQIHSF